MRIHLQGFIRRSETSMGQTLANRYIYGQTKSNPRASVGLRTISNRARDNPGTRAGIKTRENKQVKTITTEWALYSSYH